MAGRTVLGRNRTVPGIIFEDRNTSDASVPIASLNVANAPHNRYPKGVEE
ncbi:hypothetical protein ABID21_002205 [Pseudorhizobium tarimense]|uniref:Uncharacterized protein n=1 Tax=Pseudorhizobium tarimense TaxID=1079109 RepID=A0ABV2H6C5_9HYPH